MYWATHSSVRSFARTAHLFACSGLLASLAPSAVLTRLLTCSLPSLWESEFLMSQSGLVLSHRARIEGRRKKAKLTAQKVIGKSDTAVLVPLMVFGVLKGVWTFLFLIASPLLTGLCRARRTSKSERDLLPFGKAAVAGVDVGEGSWNRVWIELQEWIE